MRLKVSMSHSSCVCVCVCVCVSLTCLVGIPVACCSMYVHVYVSDWLLSVVFVRTVSSETLDEFDAVSCLATLCVAFQADPLSWYDHIWSCDSLL